MIGNLESTNREAEPRWPVVIALLAVGVLHYALPSPISFGPDWLVLGIIVLLLIPTSWARRAGNQTLSEVLGHCISGLITLALITSIVLLIYRLPSHRDSPKVLLRAAIALWSSNVLVFASWYWRLDGGGPNQRERRGRHTKGAFLFPQMTIVSPRMPDGSGVEQWRPGFVDYLFLAFNTSTAFSPTDVPVLSRWAKLMMMVQASISLVTLAILAARAVNIL